LNRSWKEKNQENFKFRAALLNFGQQPKVLSLRGGQAEILRSKSQLGNVAIFWIEQTERQLLNISFFPA